MADIGRFIAIEGGDGSGKGTLIAALADRFRHRDVLATREPGGTPEGLALRALLLSEQGHAWTPHAELLLMTAARVQHVERVIRPALAAGRLVLCDRYLASTLAYQGAGRAIETALILELHRRAVGELWPDLTVLLDVAPAIGLRRSRARLADANLAGGRLDEGRFERLDLAFHERVRASFLAQAEAAPHAFVVIDAGRPLADVRDRAISAVEAFIRRGGPPCN